MQNQKQQYRVFACHTQEYNDEGRTDKWEEPIGTTFALSEKQAINNVKFRNGIRPGHCICADPGDSYVRITRFRAETIPSSVKEKAPREKVTLLGIIEF